MFRFKISSRAHQRMRRLCSRNFLASVGVALMFSNLTASVEAKRAETNVDKAYELVYGPVLYENFQRDFFGALVEQAYAEETENVIANSPNGQVLKGGMMLSFGMADEAKKIFDELLILATNKNISRQVRNRAWYYLARFYYLKNEMRDAANALMKVDGKLPKDLLLSYHYLATLIGASGNYVEISQSQRAKVPKQFPLYAYLVFNQGIEALRSNEIKTAVQKLEEVTRYASKDSELSILADRARLGLAQLAMRSGQLSAGWKYLQNVSTEGLYSNRALLAYSWAAVKSGQYTTAIPALELLDGRAIEIPEVQEGKVLLGHLYEQEGAPRKALKSYLVAEKAFKEGIDKVDDARKVIAKKDVPREFVTNLDSIVKQQTWFKVEPTVDYTQLTPFLIDLMSSNAFNEVLKELADLYEIKTNLEFWRGQTEEHQTILRSAATKTINTDMRQAIVDSFEFKERFNQQQEELDLKKLSLSVEDQKRMQSLLESVRSELSKLHKNVDRLKTIQVPYRQPSSYAQMVSDHHARVRKQLSVTESYIKKLEPVMRKMVDAELTRHEERMRYYWAQSRLAKARLYDSTLLELEDAQGISPVGDS